MFLGYTQDDGKGWSARDRELAKALMLYDMARCPGCGHSKAETWLENDDDAEFDYIAEEIQCITCARLESARSGTKTQKGMHYVIERHPRSGKGDRGRED